MKNRTPDPLARWSIVTFHDCAWFVVKGKYRKSVPIAVEYVGTLRNVMRRLCPEKEQVREQEQNQ